MFPRQEHLRLQFPDRYRCCSLTRPCRGEYCSLPSPVAMAYAAHPESLPLDWEDKAYLIREGALYVDLREDGWHTPDQFVANDYTALRLQAVHYLEGVTAAFERHKQLHA